MQFEDNNIVYVFYFIVNNTNFEQKLIKIENNIRKCCNVFFLKINIILKIGIKYIKINIHIIL